MSRSGASGSAGAGAVTRGAELRVQGLRVTLPAEGRAIEAVKGATFTVPGGGIHGLVGESGSGKSVTALTLMGLNDPGARVSGAALLRTRSGEEIDLVQPAGVDWREIRGERLAIVFQDPLSSLSPYMRVSDQIAEALLAHRDISRSTARDRAAELLDEVGLPDARRRGREYPHTLSGGMRQRVMIAIALANAPDLLIADEPTASLDVTTQAGILDLIEGLRERHRMSVLLISHDLALVSERAETVSVMEEGRIVEEGAVGEVLTRPSSPCTRALVEAVPDIEHPRLVTPIAVSHGRSGPLLEASSLSKAFTSSRSLWPGRASAETLAVDSVDLVLEAGSTLGLVGESGSGKTTLCRLLARLIDPSSGSIRFRGRDITRLGQRQLRPVRAAMQMVFQDPYASLNPRHRVGEIVGAPIALHGIASGGELTRLVGRLLERVGLSSSDADRYPHQFSGGQRQRIAIARALGPSPELLIADEPVSALDVTVQAGILELLGELREDFGLAMVFVSHDLAVVRQVADRIAVMQAGRVVETGSAERVCGAPSDPYTRVLLDSVPRLRAA